MSRLTKLIGRKPWIRYGTRGTFFALVCSGLLPLLFLYLLVKVKKQKHIFLPSISMNTSEERTVHASTPNLKRIGLIESDWEPLKSYSFVKCEPTGIVGHLESQTGEEWFPYIDKIKKDNFIILSNTNCGYIDFALNFLEHYKSLGYTNIVLIAEDCITYGVLKNKVGKHHVAPPILIRGNTSEAEIRTEIFRNMTLLRPKYLHYFLNRGVSVMWQDIDSVPIRKTMDYFPRGFDVVAVDDSVTDAHYSSKYLCACLLFLNPTHRVLELLSIWMYEIESNLANPNDHDQYALNRALASLRKKNEITLAILPRTVYPNGHDYDSFASTAAWIHANYIIGGQSKRDFLKRNGYWTVIERTIGCV